MSKSVLRAAIEGEELVIRIGVDTLCFAVQQGNGIEPGIKITDEQAFASWVASNVIEFDTDESGTSALERVFDEMAVDALEGAQTFVSLVDVDDDEHPDRDGYCGRRES